MTCSGTLLDTEGLLCINQFEEVMRDQMKRFVQRQLTNALTIKRFTGSEEVQLTTMKAILQEQVVAQQSAISLFNHIAIHDWTYLPTLTPFHPH
jgi:hypothetical protein